MNEEFIKEIIKSTISGEPHLGTNLKEQCLMYFDNLISENKQLKEELKQKEDIINKAREKIKLLGKFDGNTCTRGLQMWSADFNKLLEILDINKGE